MNEGDVIEQTVQFTNILLVGISLIFSIVSAYIVALNYFIGSSNISAKIGAFVFVSLVLGMLIVVMMGAQATQIGLILRLRELEASGEITAAGRAVLANATPDSGGQSIDSFVRIFAWIGLLAVYGGMAYLTFLHKWTPDAIPVQIAQPSTQQQQPSA